MPGPGVLIADSIIIILRENIVQKIRTCIHGT